MEIIILCKDRIDTFICREQIEGYIKANNKRIKKISNIHYKVSNTLEKIHFNLLGYDKNTLFFISDELHAQFTTDVYNCVLDLFRSRFMLLNRFEELFNGQLLYNPINKLKAMIYGK